MLILGESVDFTSISPLLYHILFYNVDQHVNEMASTDHELLAGHTAIRLKVENKS